MALPRAPGPAPADGWFAVSSFFFSQGPLGASKIPIARLLLPRRCLRQRDVEKSPAARHALDAPLECTLPRRRHARVRTYCRSDRAPFSTVVLGLFLQPLAR